MKWLSGASRGASWGAKDTNPGLVATWLGRRVPAQPTTMSENLNNITTALGRKSKLIFGILDFSLTQNTSCLRFPSTFFILFF
jgi:hypothetical protein